MRFRGKVLVVDDDPIVLEITRDRLERAGYTVSIRERALGTSTAILQEDPDVILLDVAMPGLSGEALAKIISQKPQYQRIAIVFHSGGDVADLASLVERSGAAGSIQKTGDDTLFLLQFDRLVANWKARTEAPSPALPSSGSRKV